MYSDGKTCPYCNNPTEYVDSSEVYSKSYGMIYLCRPCDAWVGTHKPRPTEALGRLANAELREWKKAAHAVFDPLYQRKMAQGFSKTQSRKRAYKWLGKEMGIDVRECHIGFFDVEQCKQAIEICKKIK